MTMPAPSFQDLTVALQGLGWNLDGVEPPSKQTPKYVATATGPDGVKKKVCDGPSPEFALGNLVAFAQRHNQIRAYAATQKVAGWDLPWENQMEEIGKAYGELPVFDPKAVPHWQALAQESKHQADAIRKQLKVNVTDDPEPYPHVGAMIHDIHHKGNFTVSRAHSDHPVWSVPDNVNFRIVHDVLGHGQTGGDFGWNGENKACGIHFPMVSRMARPALFTECIGQTAYALRKGSHGFGQQKIGVLPQFLDPVEKMNGEHVYIPHGKFAYPEEIDGGGGAAAWGWYKDPQTGIWKQDENATGTGEYEKAASVRERIVVADVASDLSDPETGDKLWDDQHQMFQGRDPNHDYVTPADITQQAGMTGHPDFNGDQVKAGTPSDWLDRTGTYQNTAKMVVPWWERGSNGAWKYPVKEQERIIMNAFRLCMLSPLKNLKWNFAHYQGIMNLPVDATGREMWDVLDNTRRQHNKARGFDEDEHLSYYKEIKVLAGYITYETGKHKSEALKDAKQQVYEKVSEFERQLTAQHEQGTLKLESTPGEWSGEDDDTDEEGISPLRIYLTAHQMVDEWLRGLLAARSPQSEADRPEHEQLALASLRKQAAELGMDDEMRGVEKLEQGRNMFGPLGPEIKQRILTFLSNPSPETWQTARSTIVGADGWTTLWQAVIKATSEFGGSPYLEASATPDPQTVVRALEAVIPDAHVPDTIPDDWHMGAKNPRPGDTSFEGETFGGKEKYAGFMGAHLDNISKIAPVLPEIRAAALKDIYTDGGRGFIFRNAVLNLKSQYKLTGLNPKVISFIWLLMYPEGSDLGIVDTHVARAFQRDYKDVGSIKDYYKLERMQKAIKDSTGYPDMPLGTFHHGMWDVVRSKDWRKGVTHSDHSPGAIDQPEPWDQHEYDMDTGSAKMGTWIGPTAFEQARPLAENVGARYEAQYQGQAKNRIPYSVMEDMAQRAAHFDPSLFTPTAPGALKPVLLWFQGLWAQGGWGDGNTTVNISTWITAFWQAMGVLKKHNDKARAQEAMVAKGVPREVAAEAVAKMEQALWHPSSYYLPYADTLQAIDQMPDTPNPAQMPMPEGQQMDRAAGWVLAADEVVPNGGDLPFKPGDRVQIGGTGNGEYGTVMEVEPAPEDYVPEECEMCGMPTEDNLDEEGLCRGCFNRPHEHDPTVWVTVKLDNGKTVRAGDSILRFVQGMEPVPARPPATQQTHPGPDSPQAIDDMLRNAGWMPQDPNSPHGGYANTGDVVCNQCGSRTTSTRGYCDHCNRDLDGTEQPIIAGNYDPQHPGMKEGAWSLAKDEMGNGPTFLMEDGRQLGDAGLDDDEIEDDPREMDKLVPAFHEYVTIHNRADRDDGEHQDIPEDEMHRLLTEFKKTAATDPDYTFVFYQGGLVVEPYDSHPNMKDMAGRLLKDFGFPSMTDHDNGPGTDNMRLWSAGDVWGDGDHIQITQLSDPDVADDARQAVRAYFEADKEPDGHAVVVTQDDGEWEVQEPKMSTQQDPAVEEALEWEMEPETEVEDWELA